MDTYLAITSKRDVRSYADTPVEPETIDRILGGGRLSGSARNRQPWRFVVLESEAARKRASEAVYAPTNVSGAALAIAIVTTGNTGLDHGRAAQNMMLAAWNDGVVSCPNGISDHDMIGKLLGLTETERTAILISFGLPRRPADPARRTPQEWGDRADRKPLEDLVSRL